MTISSDLEAMQALVGGYLQELAISSDVVILCDEEGKLKGKPYNCTFRAQNLVGTVVFIGVETEDGASIPMSQSEFRANFPALYKEA